MTMAGWVFMLCSCGFVVLLTGYCYCRVLTTPQTAEHMQAPLEMDTRDADT